MAASLFPERFFQGSDGVSAVADGLLLFKLHLREGRGGVKAALTPYTIPTLEEVLTVAKERLFIILDKCLQNKFK